jgi:hypothetical protein
VKQKWREAGVQKHPVLIELVVVVENYQSFIGCVAVKVTYDISQHKLLPFGDVNVVMELIEL